jgi:RNA polymerase sigma-70 factor (ECF subfamily)
VARIGTIPAEGRPDLVARCRRGDSAAWRSLYEAHADRVCAFAHRLGVPTAEVPDLLQEVFVVVFRKLPEFDGRVAFTTWLLGIALNEARSWRRRRLRREMVRLWGWLPWGRDAAVEGPDRSLESSRAVGDLAWILDRMSDKLREVFVLYEIEELDGPEIAAAVGCPLPTVRSRLRLARAGFQRLQARRRPS